jgi:metal-responsive CopG/Arc/MetJ family transcriptional regulator
MKVKTSVSLSEKLLAIIDRDGLNRSEFLENAAWEFIHRQEKVESSRRDLEIINANADFLNQEASEFLELQAAWLEQNQYAAR